MLYTPDDRHPAGFKPSSGWGRHAPISNGVVGTIVDSGIVYLSGTFNGPDVSTTKAYAANFSNPGARPHLAKTGGCTGCSSTGPAFWRDYVFFLWVAAQMAAELMTTVSQNDQAARFPPFFTLQPNDATRAKQLSLWAQLIADWSRS